MWASDFNQENRLLHGRLRRQFGCETNAASWRCNLPSSTVNRISMQSDIHDVEANSSHVLLTERAFFARPLESTVHVLFDLIHVLDSLRLVNNDICSLSLRTPTPNFSGCILIPLKLFTVQASTLLHFCLGSTWTIFNRLGKLLSKWLCRDIHAIVLVW